jgi:hypothetical protein
MTSRALLTQMWPAACGEVMLLVQVLRMSSPSLADALSIGLLSVLAPPAGPSSAQVSLGYRSAVIVAMAATSAGITVTGPHLRASEVSRLEVTDVAAAGRSGLRLAG